MRRLPVAGGSGGFVPRGSRCTASAQEQQKLGAGGMGTVYKVRNKADHQLYAVKKFHGTRNSGDTLIMQYDHPNIVRYVWGPLPAPSACEGPARAFWGCR